MMERKQNIKQLRNIKGYLTGVKTGKNCHIKNKVMNRTQYVNSDDNSNVFMSLISSMFSWRGKMRKFDIDTITNISYI